MSAMAMRWAVPGVFLLACQALVCAQAGHEPPEGTWVIPENALDEPDMSGSAADQTTLEQVAVEQRPFDSALRVRTHTRPQHAYNMQLVIPNSQPLQRDDVLYGELYVRTIQTRDETGQGQISFVLEKQEQPWTKSVQQPYSFGDQWTRIMVPFRAVESYQPGEARLAIRTGHAEQTIEIAGLRLVNLGPDAEPDELPRTELTYAGREPDAPWREEARQRIEQIRMSELSVRVEDAAGRPVEQARVAVQMQEHAFPFGSCYAPPLLADEHRSRTEDARRYQQKFKKLFNIAVDEYTMKWPAWEDPERRQWAIDAAAWIRSHDIALRGHTLVWPSWRWAPSDARAMADEPRRLGERVRAHIRDMVSHFAGDIVAWDVVNEPYTNHDLLDILGEQVMIEWFKLVRELDPDARLVLNETTSASMRGGMDEFERTIRMLLDGGAPLDALGFQSHFATNAIPPEEVLEIFDRFARFDLPIEITEFDVETVDEQYQADYTRDYMIAAFSHPSVISFLHWGFWEGQHWKPNAALYRRDWSIKPNGQVYKDLVFDQWWTDEAGRTDASGRFDLRVFHGRHVVSVSGDGREQQVEITLGADDKVVTIELP